MQSYKGSDFLEAGTASRSRTSSISSDSQFPRVNLMSPPAVRPAPAFISASAASEIITSDQEFNAADFTEDDGTGAANALVTPAALSLLNGFLDNLLFNVLAASKSTQLTCIRPAVADVLRPRLAQEVVATADEELSEYMGGAEDEETEFRGGQEPGGDFDLVRSWKLTRLRCMVYTRLGDMEEEDEDEFIVQEGLGECDGAPRRFSSHVDNITPAAAIFLTSIIEHIGERALVIAGETSRSRLSAQLNDRENASVESADERKRIDRLVVEDLDMEKLALNATLGRLWRTWRKRRRSTTVSRTVSRESFRRRAYSHNLAGSRKSSIATIEEPITPKEPVHEEAPAPIDPADVPLPMSDHDIQEIEVPGYSAELEGEVQTMEAVVAHKVRPRSLMVFSSPPLAPRSPGAGESPVSASAIENASLRHLRSRSLPNAPSPKLPVPEPSHAENAPADQPSPSTSEERRQLETMYEDDESAEFVDAAESTESAAPGIAITTENDQSTTPGAVEAAEKARMSIVPEAAEEEDDEEMYPDVNEIVATLRSDAHRGAEGDNHSVSTRVSISSVSDYGGSVSEPEVIEGRGTYEKPTLTSIQRPRRQSTRDVSQPNAKSISAGTSEPETQPAVEAPQSTQGMESTPAPQPAAIEAIDPPRDNDDIDGDQNKSIMTSPPDLPAHSHEEAAVTEEAAAENPQQPSEPTEPAEPTTVSGPAHGPETPRPASASGDSERSQRSRRPRPSPLVVTASNRSSPSTAERATVQRMPTRPSTSVSSVQTKSRRSESFSSARDKRPVTAGSTTSQVSHKLKGLMGRPQAESPSLRLRSSSETSRASGSAESVENDTTDLDKLINSDETIHYTLTPRSVREMTFPEVPRPIPRSETQDTSELADFLKNTGPVSEEPPRLRGSVSSRATGATGATGEVTSLGRVKSTGSPKHIPISPRVASPAKTSAAQARDARTTGDSTREFAEFIKSTGPTSAPFQSPVASPTADSFKGARSQSKLSVSSNASRSNRPRLQARSADTGGSQASDLIDFIREGPPQPGAHRIPRSVAPFRNTIDSEDLQLDSPQNEKDNTTRSSFSTRDGSTPNKSLTSLGSRTGLLDSKNRSNGQAKATGSKPMPPQDDPRPPRKQRRVPDPYAIDDDDGDDELFAELNDAKPQRKEESLIDFLRSEPPPDFEQAPPQPLNVKIPPSSSSSGGVASPSGLKARLLGSSSGKSPGSKLSMSSLRSQSNLNNNTKNTPENKPPQSSYSAKVGVERNPGTIPSASHRQTETGALADFLRNTGPPGPPPGQTPNSPRLKEGGFSRLFVRRKKVEA